MSLNASSDGSGLDLKQENPFERNIYNLKRSRPKANRLLNPISANASVIGHTERMPRRLPVTTSTYEACRWQMSWTKPGIFFRDKLEEVTMMWWTINTVTAQGNVNMTLFCICAFINDRFQTYGFKCINWESVICAAYQKQLSIKLQQMPMKHEWPCETNIKSTDQCALDYNAHIGPCTEQTFSTLQTVSNT